VRSGEKVAISIRPLAALSPLFPRRGAKRFLGRAIIATPFAYLNELPTRGASKSVPTRTTRPTPSTSSRHGAGAHIGEGPGQRCWGAARALLADKQRRVAGALAQRSVQLQQFAEKIRKLLEKTVFKFEEMKFPLTFRWACDRSA
jgi:hypothetical protein